LEDGQADPRPAVAVAVVEHVALAVGVEHERVGDHLGVPAIRGDVEAGPLVESLPRQAVARLRVAEAIGRPAMAVPHAIEVAVPAHTRAGDGGLALVPAIDAQAPG